MTPVRGELQRAALDSILASKTFERSEQLKAILRYVCERTWEGHSDLLTEYSIGVDVLGKGAAFSPQEDSIVRNRAYALRKKLDEYYESEGAGDSIRISLPKGAYAPEFSEYSIQAPPPPPRPSLPWMRIAVVALTALLIGALLEHWRLLPRLRPSPGPATRAFWGPFLEEIEPTILCVSSPPQSFLRSFPVPESKVSGIYPVDKPIVDWLDRQRVERHGPYLLQVPTMNSPLWGDAAGATRISQFLTQYGSPPEVVAERLIALPALRNRNVVFLSTSEYSSAAVRLLRDLPLGIAYDIPSDDHVPLRYDASGRIVERFPVKRQDGQLTEVYGLITRVLAEGDGGKNRLYFILSGVSSAGILAAAEFASSPKHIEELSSRTNFDSEPLQILIKVRADKTIPLSFDYLTHIRGKRR